MVNLECLEKIKQGVKQEGQNWVTGKIGLPDMFDYVSVWKDANTGMTSVFQKGFF